MTANNTPNGNRNPARPGPQPAPGSWATVEPPARSVYDLPPGTINNVRTTYRATPEQLARDDARHRYLRRNVYAPVLVAVLLVVLAFAAVVVLGLFVRTPAALSFIAGLAGLTVILLSIPLIALMSILPLAYLGWWANRRQQRQLYPEYGPMAYRSRLQVLLWQLESVLERAGLGVNRGAEAIARPLMGIHARADYWREFARSLRRQFTRSK